MASFLRKPFIDRYVTLGLKQGSQASQQDIRKAYHALALKNHPDKNKNEDTTEKFKIISAAYETLNSKRKQETMVLNGR